MNAGITEKAVLYSRSRFSWGLSEIRAAKPDGARLLREAPAAFRRLCVETLSVLFVVVFNVPAAFRRLCVETRPRQPKQERWGPAAFRRLCVETSIGAVVIGVAAAQPPSGGCVLKLYEKTPPPETVTQPPSGGCVLKLGGAVCGQLGIASRLQAAVC